MLVKNQKRIMGLLATFALVLSWGGGRGNRVRCPKRGGHGKQHS